MINYSTVFSLLSEGIRIPDNRSCSLAGRYLRCFSSAREVGYSSSFYIRDFVMVNAPRTAVADKLVELGRDILWMFPEFIEVPDAVQDRTAYRRTVLEQLVEPYLQPFIIKKGMDFTYDRMLMPALGDCRKSFSQAQKATLRAIWKGLKPAEISMLWWNNDFSRLMTSLATDKALKALLRQIERPRKLAPCLMSEKKKIHAKAHLVLNRFCKPSVAITEGASNYHHMTEDVLQYGASMDNNKISTWPEIYPEIVSILKGRTIKAYRVDFDSYMIRSSCRAFNLDTVWMETCQWEDMKLFMNSATRIGRS